MAAHILSAMNEFLDGRLTVSQFRHGMSYAQLGDTLEQDDWQLLDLLSLDEYTRQSDNPYLIDGEIIFIAAVRKLLPVYRGMHYKLGEPSDAAEWIRKRYYDPECSQDVTRYHLEKSSKTLKEVFSKLPDYPYFDQRKEDTGE